MKKWQTQNFLTGTELTHGELESTLALAQTIKKERTSGVTRTDLLGRHVALIFEKPSMRTRVSFTVAVQELGGKIVELASSQRKTETPEDTIRVLNGYVDAAMIRTFEHQTLEQMAKATQIPLINGLCDLHHPCQALADLMTLLQRFGSLNGLKLAYVGDGNNVLHSLLLLAPYLGVEVRYACPKGYEPNSFVVKHAQVRAKEGGGKIVAHTEPEAAVLGANALYTDVWASMGFEDEQAERERVFAKYQLNSELYQKAAEHAVILHCMPMLRGKEITNEMADHANSLIFNQSENRLHVQKAILIGLLSGANG